MKLIAEKEKKCLSENGDVVFTLKDFNCSPFRVNKTAVLGSLNTLKFTLNQKYPDDIIVSRINNPFPISGNEFSYIFDEGTTIIVQGATYRETISLTLFANYVEIFGKMSGRHTKLLTDEEFDELLKIDKLL